MFHTQRDAALFLAGMLLLLGTTAALIDAVAVAIALVCRTFRSARAVVISLIVTAIATIPFAWAMTLRWSYIAELRSIETTPHIPTVANAVLLSFVWVAPLIQFARRKPMTPPGGAGHEPLDSDEAAPRAEV